MVKQFGNACSFAWPFFLIFSAYCEPIQLNLMDFIHGLPAADPEEAHHYSAFITKLVIHSGPLPPLKTASSAIYLSLARFKIAWVIYLTLRCK